MKVALILCDEIAKELQPTYGTYRARLTDLVQNHLEDVIIDEFNLFANNELPSLEASSAYAAIIISGSKSSATNTEHHQWIVALEQYIRDGWFIKERPSPSILIGICFGHQIVGKVAGARVVENPPNAEEGWSFGKTVLCIKRDLLESQLDLMDFPEIINLPSIHKQQLDALPTGFYCWCSSSECKVEGMMRLDGQRRDILTVQGHPELSMAYVADAANVRFQLGLIPKSARDKAQTERDSKIQSTLFAQIMARFINLVSL